MAKVEVPVVDAMAKVEVPVVDAGEGLVAWEDVARLFEAHRIVHVKRAAVPRRPRPAKWLAEVARHERAGLCAATYCAEGGAAVAARDAFGERQPEPWYASFVLRDARATEALLRRFPRGGLGPRAIPGVAGADADHGAHCWLFVGDNRAGAAPLAGRAEHTDDLAAAVAGTWHLQLAGAKDWHVRPAVPPRGAAAGAKRRRTAARGDVAPAVVRCATGDALLVDTRAWRHRTTLPADGEVSASCARDFSLDAAGAPPEAAYDNVDATLAATALDPGDVVFAEDELPDCALPRRADANCAVAEADDGTLVLVATRPIVAGDVLSVPPSDDEEGDDSSDDDDDDDGASGAG